MGTKRKSIRKAKEKSVDRKESMKLAASLVDDFERRLKANEEPPLDPAAYLRQFRGSQGVRKNLRVQLNLAMLMIVGAREGVIDWDRLEGKPTAPRKKGRRKNTTRGAGPVV